MARPKRTPLTPHLLEHRQRLGLTQEQVAERIGITPEMVRRHEQGLSTPIAFYQARYCKLYGADEFALGFRPATASVILTASSTVAIGDASDNFSGFEELLTRAKGVTSASVADLQLQIDGLRTLDRQLGSPAALEPTRLLTRTMQELMEHVAVGSTRSGLAAVLSDAAALNAWQILNSGDVRTAWSLHNLARSAGLEAGRADLLAHAMGEQSYGLIDLDRPQDALQLIGAARETAGTQVPALLRSWLLAAEAEALAAVGDGARCRSALDAAARLLPTRPDNAETPYVSLDDWHFERWRGNILAKLGDATALDSLMVALDGTPATFVRATASLHCDIAQSLAVRGDRTSALQHAQKARTLARQTGSIRQLRRIEAVTRKTA